MGNSYVQKIQKRLQWKFRDPCDKSAEIIRKPSEFSQFCGLGISKTAKYICKMGNWSGHKRFDDPAENATLQTSKIRKVIDMQALRLCNLLCGAQSWTADFWHDFRATRDWGTTSNVRAEHGQF